MENDLAAKYQTEEKRRKLAIAKETDAPYKPKRGTINELNPINKIATDIVKTLSSTVLPA